MTFKIRNSNFALDCSLARINPHVTRVVKTKKVMMQSHHFSYAVTTLITLYYLLGMAILPDPPRTDFTLPIEVTRRGRGKTFAPITEARR